MALAAKPDEQEDRTASKEGEDERRRARHLERKHPDPEQQEEEDGPKEGLDSLVDARHAQVHERDPSERAGGARHQKFTQIAAITLGPVLHGHCTPDSFLLAGSTERD